MQPDLMNIVAFRYFDLSIDYRDGGVRGARALCGRSSTTVYGCPRDVVYANMGVEGGSPE